jgi:hypothetical protein
VVGEADGSPAPHDTVIVHAAATATLR